MRILADLHVHTLASGHAYSTIGEIAAAAAAKQLELVAITDHGPAMPGGPHEYYFGNLRVLPAEIGGVTILRGAEVNILDEHGRLDLPEAYLKQLDIVLVGLHNVCTELLCRERNTRALIRAMQNRHVDIVVHPGNPDFPIVLEEVVCAAKQLGKALEINNSSFFVRQGSSDICLEIAHLAKQHDVLISISSDAHYAADVGKLERALALVLQAGVPEKNILNLNAERVKRFLASRGKVRFARGEAEHEFL
ncbi:MAG: phosphatase [Dethiobacter sp.]|nr:phosphatase [Dethiobacter sp.]MBS3901268.1 phosphatase [Dethiobacter sp.]